MPPFSHDAADAAADATDAQPHPTANEAADPGAVPGAHAADLPPRRSGAVRRGSRAVLLQLVERDSRQVPGGVRAVRQHPRAQRASNGAECGTDHPDHPDQPEPDAGIHTSAH